MLGKNFLILFSILLTIVGCHHTSATADSSDKISKEIELRNAVEKVWQDANQSNIEELKAAHLNSPKFSKFGPRIAERQDVESTNNTETEHFLSITDANLIIEDLKIDIFGDIGITTFYNNYSFIKNNIEVKGKGRVTLVFLKTEEGWKIIHEHSSPFKE